MTSAISNSELKVWRRCRKQWEYKYLQLLVPKTHARALYIGSWVHRAIETHYTQGDWQIGHQEYLDDYNSLFEEQRAILDKRGKLSDKIPRIIKSYIWYYRDDGWTVHSVERKFIADTKYGPLGGRIDLIIQDADGLLWVVDHKTASTIPTAGSFHAMDPQLMIYPWAAKKFLGLDIAGIIFNYISSKPPTMPKLVERGIRLSKQKINTDYPTLYRFLKKNNLDPHDFSEALLPLRKKSPFLRRYRLPREEVVVDSIMKDAFYGMREINLAREGKIRFVRTITKDCSRFCAYHDLCRAELNGLDTGTMRKKYFNIDTEERYGLDDTGEHDEDNDDSDEDL